MNTADTIKGLKVLRTPLQVRRRAHHFPAVELELAREHAQQTDQRHYLRAATARRLTPLARYILDVDE